jgi:23S rRNA (guanosine2251-2'-O)-methyltransferase
MKLYGRNCITERIKKNPKTIKKIFIEINAVETQNFASLQNEIKSHRIPVERISKNEFNKKSQGIPSQGMIAETADFEYVYLEAILGGGDTLSNPPTILFLDSLNDPQNLGGIIRTAACLGGFAIVLPKHDSVEVTEAALRVAQGGENYVAVAKVTNLALAIQKAKKAGYWIAGAVLEDGEDLRKVKFNFPLGIVIGSEGKGIRPGLMNSLDFRFTLPMPGARLSFNAAIAAALFCYEAARQRSSSQG